MKNKLLTVILKCSVQSTLLIEEMQARIFKVLPFAFGGGLLAGGIAHAAGGGGGGGGGGADILQKLGEYVQTGIGFALGAVVAVAFVVVAYSAIAALVKAFQGRGDWGTVLLYLIVGAVIIVFVSYLAEEGKTKAGEITATGGNP